MTPEQARADLLRRGIDITNLSDSKVFAIARRKQDESDIGNLKDHKGINGTHSPSKGGANHEPPNQEELEFKTIRRAPRERDSIILGHKENEEVGRIMG